MIASTASDSYLTKLLKRGLFTKLSGLRHGRITVVEGSDQNTFGDSAAALHATVHIHSPEFFWKISKDGSVGAALSYVKNEWSSPELVDVIRLFSLNIDMLNQVDGGLVSLQYPIRTVDYWRQRNDRTGARNNISAHYDLSNELFKTFLDERMMYSSAYYSNWNESLDQAQRNKLDRICKKLELKNTDSICEIGTGWGGFAIFAAQNYGCKVTTTTISEEQFKYARSLVEKLGLSDRVTLLMKDYRDLQGQFDKVVSIEMIEAVGHQYLDEYMQKISNLLKPDGLALLQAITINDQQYQRAVNEVDFIKKYIFPGSFIPSVHRIIQSTKDGTDLRLYHMEDSTDHYAKTLSDWRQRFLSQKSKIVGLGFDEEFIRLWDYYFCYCIGGFRERAIGLAQLAFGKPQYRSDFSSIKF